MTSLLIAVNSILLVVALLLLHTVLRRNAEKKQRSILSEWDVPKIDLEDLDPIFAQSQGGPTLASEVHFVGKSNTDARESWILAVLAKKALKMFEFGTLSGHTAYLWARNSPPGALVTTLTLGEDQHSSYKWETGDDRKASEAALTESNKLKFVYDGTKAALKIDQRYGDSKNFDESVLINSCDLIFVDGSHAYSYVKNDSGKALRMAREGGLILWHDYRGPREIPGVYKALGELAQRIPIRHVRGTTLVAYRKVSGSPR